MFKIVGNAQNIEIENCLKYNLIPTISSKDATEGILQHVKQASIDGIVKSLVVHIKVDTGLSRYGCQPEELPELMKVL